MGSQQGGVKRVGDEIGAGTIEAAAKTCEAVDLDDGRNDVENAWRLCNSANGGYERDAVSAATRALEGMVQKRTGQPGVSLNRIRGLDTVVQHEKLRGMIQSLYSYSSDQARHAKEGAAITSKDAHFTVSVVAALISYLGDLKRTSSQNAQTGEDGRTTAPGAPSVETQREV